MTARKMKDSGIEWIGEIPEVWEICKQKHVVTLINGRAFSDDEFETNGKYRILRVGNLFTNPIWYTSSLELEPEKYCEEGDLLYAWSMSYAPIIWHGEKVIYHYHIWKVSLAQIICKQFAFYYFIAITDALMAEKHETTMSFITMGIMNNSYIAFPNKDEQREIADYLDAKCAEIDRVVAETEKTIEEYKVLKQSIITEAVTKGVRGKRPMKDSGSVWFDSIPENWKMSKLKYMFSIKKRIVGEDGHTVLAITQKGVKPKDMAYGNGQFAESYANYQIVHPGDFAMNHMDLLTGWVDISKYEGVTSPDYRVFTLNNTLNCSKYYLYMMQMCYTNRIFYSMGQGVSGMGRWRLPSDMFNNFLIACPPLSEQREIADYLDAKCAEIDRLVAAKQTLLAELATYKKSLIYEYVTGKKEVPECL